MPAMLKVTRYHDISCGHRVPGHEGKCKNLHGHNYRITFTCQSHTGMELDDIGRVIDFGVIKDRLCMWVEQHWDHRMLLWVNDPWFDGLRLIDNEVEGVSFIPTAENMAKYLLEVVGPTRLGGTGIILTGVLVEETRKCAAEATLI